MKAKDTQLITKLIKEIKRLRTELNTEPDNSYYEDKINKLECSIADLLASKHKDMMKLTKELSNLHKMEIEQYKEEVTKLNTIINYLESRSE